MSKIELFEFQDHPVRVVLIEDEPWWVAADVCRALTIGNPSEAIRRLDKDDLSQTEVIDARGRSQSTNLINESGLYTLILRSDKPEAKLFKRWVTKEVLPAIRKTGFYQPEPLADSSNEALRSLEAIALDSQIARTGVLNGTLAVETAQAVSSLCAQGLRAWELRLRIKPEVLPAGLALGSAHSADIGKIIQSVAETLEEDKTLSLSEIFQIASTAGIVSGELTPAIGKSLGRGLQHWRGHEFSDRRGRQWKMSRRRTKAGARYAFTFLSESSR